MNGWRAPAFLFALGLCAQVAAAQDAPVLSVYVTDQNADVFVAIYGTQSAELSGCATAEAARSLLQLPGQTAIFETTFADLTQNFALGRGPRLPCPGAAFDADWPATAPIWADVAGTGNYFLPALTGAGHIVLPARCTGLKTALAIRERLQLPGVLQATTPPPGLGSPDLVLGCGDAAAEAQAPQITPTGTGWSLHRFLTFLSEDSPGDTIYVARNLGAGSGSPSYLPILRVDGQEARDLILGGGPAMLQAEAALSALIGAPPDAPVTLLGSDEIPALRDAIYADLCLTNCAGYAHRHAAFLRPGLDLGVTALPALAAEGQIDRLGAERLVIRFAEGRGAVFTGCPALTGAMGLSAALGPDWFAATQAALTGEPDQGQGFDCRGGGSSTCTRLVPEGGALTLAAFAAEGDCAAARHLRLELGNLAVAPQPLLLEDLPFETVDIAPAQGIGRSRLLVTPGLLSARSDICFLAASNALIVTNGLGTLSMTNIDLQRRASDFVGEVVALQAQGGRVALRDVTIGGGGEGSLPVQRGVTLCRTDLYAQGGRIMAEAINLQGLSARVMLSASTAGRLAFSQARFGLLMSAQSLIRLSEADIAAAGPIVLRGAELRGASVALTAPVPVPPLGSAVLLERGSSAELTISSVSGFRCAASFMDSGSRVSLVLPGNDIAFDNTFSACGPGQFSLIE